MPYNNTPIAPSKEVSGQVSLPLARVQKIINADPERLHTSKNAAFAIALATELFIQHLATTTHNVVKAETQKKPRRNVQYRDVAAAVAKTDNLEFLADVVPRTTVYSVVKERAAKKKAEEEEKAAKGKGKEKAAEEEGEKEGGTAFERLMAGSRRLTEKEKEKSAAAAMDQENSAEKEGGVALEKDVVPGKDDEADAMDVDEEPQTKPVEETPVVEVEDSDAEEDAAAMQIEMEMRGPRANGKAPAASPKVAKSPAKPAQISAASHRPTRSSGGFTAINGSK